MGDSVRYEEFRDQLEQALRDGGIPFSDTSRTETLVLPVLERVYEMIIGMELRQRARPFHVTGAESRSHSRVNNQ